MTFYRMYDVEEEHYIDAGGMDITEVQEVLATEWENDLYPATDMYEELHDTIYKTFSIEKLNEYASGLGYIIEVMK